ncbi:Oidioi.mRNA.OKI2018_I69.chr2.g4910.t1.cds [Oikopleura dioica]|uniref:Oidioi.mRNA.OKI2018_I69.chr2.g4910.t1.cds n=1 Tax=Oikopleura dioica TaxID=34765 RepID=A0ABN7T2I9_OIKDI|nr:Oidioi.mRNA.OKI2018_I69.chr2.g4910.t1.cds [Oikopleura dioica]
MILFASLLGLAFCGEYCSNPRVDHTLTPEAVGKDIAHATYRKVWKKISKIDEIHFQDREFLIRYALATTNYGTNTTTGQIWPLTQDQFDDTKNLYSFHKTSILNAFHLDWNHMQFSDLDVPQYSLISLILYLEMQSFFPAPFAQADQAATFTAVTKSTVGTFYDAADEIAVEVDGSCLDKEMDLVFVVDESGSVGPYNFELTKDFILHLTHCLDISAEHARVSVITYASVEHIDFNLHDYTNRNFSDVISSLTFSDGGTATYSGLDKALEVFKNSPDSTRTKTRNVLITITDGASNNNVLTCEAAERLKNDPLNIQSIAIGVGYAWEHELQCISSSSDHIHRLNNFNDFADIKSMIMNTACNAEIDVVNGTTGGFLRTADASYGSESVNLILNGTDRFELNSNQRLTVYGSYEFAKPSSVSNDFSFEFDHHGLPWNETWVEYNPQFSGKLFLTLENLEPATADSKFEIRIIKDPPVNTTIPEPIDECIKNAFCNMDSECECFSDYVTVEDRWGSGWGLDQGSEDPGYSCEAPCPVALEESEIICEPGTRGVKVPLCALRHAHVHKNNLYMGTAGCIGTLNEEEGTIDFEDGLNGCSMVENINSTHIYFTGLVYSQENGHSGNAIVSFGHALKIHATCAFEKCIRAHVDLIVNIAIWNINLGKTGQFTTSVAVYDRPDMEKPVPSDKVFEGFDDVFVNITLDDTTDFFISFKSCEAYDDTLASRPTWPLISGGSEVQDSGSQILDNFGTSIAFSFKAFAFNDFDANGPPDFGENIKIECTVCVCDPNLDQNCTPGARKRRNAESNDKNEFIVSTTFNLNQ